MNKIVWNLNTLPVQRLGRSFISVTPQKGLITFSRDLVARLGLVDKRVNFIQDKDNLRDWYLEVSTTANDGSFPLTLIPSGSSEKKIKGCYVVRCTFICKKLLRSIETDMRTTRFMVSEKATEENLYAIITKLKNGQRAYV